MPQFPENPRVGQVYTVNSDDDTTAITQIHLTFSGLRADPNNGGYGEAQAITRVPTSERKYLLRSVYSTHQLTAGDKVHVLIIDYVVLSYIFLEDCGWTPKSLSEPLTRFDRKGFLIHEPTLTLTTGEYTVFNEVCVNLPPNDEEEKDDPAQPA